MEETFFCIVQDLKRNTKISFRFEIVSGVHELLNSFIILLIIILTTNIKSNTIVMTTLKTKRLLMVVAGGSTITINLNN